LAKTTHISPTYSISRFAPLSRIHPVAPARYQRQPTASPTTVNANTFTLFATEP
jgi:hypothetical protein